MSWWSKHAQEALSKKFGGNNTFRNKLKMAVNNRHNKVADITVNNRHNNVTDMAGGPRKQIARPDDYQMGFGQGAKWEDGLAKQPNPKQQGAIGGFLSK